jgi:hypothetical protein
MQDTKHYLVENVGFHTTLDVPMLGQLKPQHVAYLHLNVDQRQHLLSNPQFRHAVEGGLLRFTEVVDQE